MSFILASFSTFDFRFPLLLVPLCYLLSSPLFPLFTCHILPFSFFFIPPINLQPLLSREYSHNLRILPSIAQHHLYRLPKHIIHTYQLSTSHPHPHPQTDLLSSHHTQKANPATSNNGLALDPSLDPTIPTPSRIHSQSHNSVRTAFQMP